MLHNMYQNMLYNHKKCYIYILQLIYTKKYNTLYKNESNIM